MENIKSFRSLLYTLNEGSFDSIALKLFRFQAEHNDVYRQYIQHLGVDPDEIADLTKIPFLPISFFKKHVIKAGNWDASTTFRSSGTTGLQQVSAHYVDDVTFYKDHSLRCFESFFGPIRDYHILALLPSYLERSDSSLVVMVDHLIKESQSPYAGFYLDDLQKLENDLDKAITEGQRKVLLWGVSFALLDLAERGNIELSGCTVLETGGMKGRRREITRRELHDILDNNLKPSQIWSEYGMTELLSQAYASGGERFMPPSSLRVLGREIGDPFNVGVVGHTCALNVIDLANAHSIAFIETEDVGNVFVDGSFEVRGRLDNSDLRGCNLMVE